MGSLCWRPPSAYWSDGIDGNSSSLVVTARGSHLLQARATESSGDSLLATAASTPEVAGLVAPHASSPSHARRGSSRSGPQLLASRAPFV